MSNHEIIVQVGPEVDLESHARDKVNLQLLDLESEMIVDALCRYDLITGGKHYAVKFRNDDLGDGVKYPILEISGKFYALTLDNGN